MALFLLFVLAMGVLWGAFASLEDSLDRLGHQVRSLDEVARQR